MQADLRPSSRNVLLRGFADRVTGNAAVPHHACLSHVPGCGAVKQTAVVPDQRVARRPAMMMNAWPLAGEVEEFIEEQLKQRIENFSMKDFLKGT